MRNVPRVSVIVPFFDPGGFLQEAIDSVLAQTFTEWNLWLVDDGSSDGSTAVARAAAHSYPGRIHYAEHPGHGHRGLPATRNAGIACSDGALVAFLDADDVWLPDKLERQVRTLDEHPGVGMVCESSQYWYSWSGDARDRHRDVVPSMVAELGLEGGGVLDPPQMLLAAYPLGTATAPCPGSLLLRRALLQQIGGPDESFCGIHHLYEDQTLLTKVYLHAPVYVGAGWGHRYRRHGGSIESTVIGGGHYLAVRRHFLDWLGAYFRSQRVEDAAIWDAWARAAKLVREQQA